MIEQLKPEWKAVLREVQKIDPYALIAGGCLRDIVHNVPIKDIDIFVTPMSLSRWGQCCLAVQEHYPTLSNDDDFDDSTATAPIECETGHMYYRRKDPIPINMILLKTLRPVEYAPRFDWGLCQIYYDGNTVTRLSPFNQDSANKTLTLCRWTDLEGVQYSYGRFERLLKKYPGYKLVVPRPARELWNAVIDRGGLEIHKVDQNLDS